MKRSALGRFSLWFSGSLEAIAGVTLLSVMVLTMLDIIGRLFGMPILGTYELVSFAGGLVLAFCMPVTSRVKGHVMVDLIIEYLPKRTRIVLHVVTRLMAMTLFLIMGWGFLTMGSDMHSVGEVSSILRFPFYPLAYAMGAAFFGECIILIEDLCDLSKFREAQHG